MPSRMSRLSRKSRDSRKSRKSKKDVFARQSRESGLLGRTRRKAKNADLGRPQPHTGPPRPR